MERKHLFYILFGVFALILIILFLVSKSLSMSPTDNNSLVECNTLSFGSESGINMVFFSNKENAEKYTNYLLGLSPFDKTKESFNFYYIDGYKPSCQLYKGVAILCYSRDIIKKAASCPNDVIVVLEDRPNNIRSSAYLQVMSINKNSPLSVFAHEFGHALAALDEEYVPASLDGNSENCKSSCSEFYNNDGCFEGCSLSSHYRSIEQGIMRTLYSNTYGKYDEDILLSKLVSKTGGTITGNVVSEKDCTNSEYYLLTGRVSNGQFIVVNMTKERGCLGGNGAGDYSYEVLTENGETLYLDDFNSVLFTDGQNEGETTLSGESYSEYSQLYLKLPVFNEADSIVIKKNDEVITKFYISDVNSMVCRIT